MSSDTYDTYTDNFTKSTNGASTNFSFSGTHACRTALPRPQRHLNLVVVGKSGVGKSSLLNYAAGREVFATGCGDPVTEDYFDCVEVSDVTDGVVYSLYDTKGIENGKTDEWSWRIFSEIERRDHSANIYDWFHTIIFCISAGDKRVEPFELDAIRRLMTRGSVVVALTKKDQVTPEQLNDLTEYIRQETGGRVPVLAVCNGACTRTGSTPPSGLENVLRASFIGLWEKIARTLPPRAMHYALGVDVSLALKPTLANMLGLMALTGEENRMFPDAYCAARFAGLDIVRGYKMLTSKKMIMPVYLEDVARRAHAAADVSDQGMVGVCFRSNVDHTFTIPAMLNRAELRRKYYRKALSSWISRWWSLAYETLEGISSGFFKKRFNEYVDITVAEVLDFYQVITGIYRKPLNRFKTDEELEALFHIAEAQRWQERLTNCRKRFSDSLETVAHKWFHCKQTRRNAEYVYMELVHETEAVHNALSAPVARIEQALETELRAYGGYCLDPDPQSLMALIRKAWQQAGEEGMSELAPATVDLLREAARAEGVSQQRLDRLIDECAPQ